MIFSHLNTADLIFFFGGHPNDALASPALGAELGDLLAFDVPAHAHRDHNLLVGDQVHIGKLAYRFITDLSPAFITILGFDLLAFILDHLIDLFCVCQ